MKCSQLPILVLIFFLSLFGLAGTARANCTNPTGVEANITYSSAYHVPQFCNGTDWVAMGKMTGGGGDTPFVTGQILGSLRNDYGEPVGFQMVVGGSGITVTALGRWVVSGNNQTHALAIYNNGCSLLGTVTVNTAGAPAGAFLYGTLSSPVTLSAGATYYVMSAEAAGGDQWYNNDTAVTTTGAAVLSSPAYSNSCAPLGAASYTYVPVDFKYH